MYKDIRQEAVRLRRQGLTYGEILAKIPVAKSTLSLWLKDVGLAKKQLQKLTQKRLEAGLRGAASRRKQRIESTKITMHAARKAVGVMSRRELWLLGIALYWAEGSKQRASSLSNSVTFNNSDPAMLKFFKEWLLQLPSVDLSRLKFELYVHESQKRRLQEIKQHWAHTLSVPLQSFQSVYFKKNVVKRVRKNPENGYYGLVRIRVLASTRLNRTIAGWIEGVAASSA